MTHQPSNKKVYPLVQSQDSTEQIGKNEDSTDESGLKEDDEEELAIVDLTMTRDVDNSSFFGK